MVARLISVVVLLTLLSSVVMADTKVCLDPGCVFCSVTRSLPGQCRFQDGTSTTYQCLSQEKADVMVYPNEKCTGEPVYTGSLGKPNSCNLMEDGTYVFADCSRAASEHDKPVIPASGENGGMPSTPGGPQEDGGETFPTKDGQEPSSRTAAAIRHTLGVTVCIDDFCKKRCSTQTFEAGACVADSVTGQTSVKYVCASEKVSAFGWDNADCTGPPARTIPLGEPGVCNSIAEHVSAVAVCASNVKEAEMEWLEHQSQQQQEVVAAAEKKKKKTASGGDEGEDEMALQDLFDFGEGGFVEHVSNLSTERLYALGATLVFIVVSFVFLR